MNVLRGCLKTSGDRADVTSCAELSNTENSESAMCFVVARLHGHSRSSMSELVKVNVIILALSLKVPNIVTQVLKITVFDHPAVT